MSSHSETNMNSEADRSRRNTEVPPMIQVHDSSVGVTRPQTKVDWQNVGHDAEGNVVFPHLSWPSIVNIGKKKGVFSPHSNSFYEEFKFQAQRSWPPCSSPTERRWGGEPVAENKRPISWRGAGVLIPLSAGPTGATASGRPAASRGDPWWQISCSWGEWAFNPTQWSSGNLLSQE